MGDASRLVMCWEKQHQFYFLPGGTLEPRENLQACLARELQEEMALEVAVGAFVGCIENHWQDATYSYQEFNFIFRVQVPPVLLESPIASQAPHIAFEVVLRQDLPKIDNVLPAQLKPFIEQYYHKDSAYLWASQLG